MTLCLMFFGLMIPALTIHTEEFARARELLCSANVVKPFDIALPTELLTVVSRLHGFGYALVQLEVHGALRLIQCGSCSLSSAQRNDATVELEASTILWAVVKCDYYL